MSVSLRRILVLVLLAWFASLQTASAVTTHTHDHSSGTHCCVICHAGHLPALESAPAQNSAPAAVAEWRPWREEAVQPAAHAVVFEHTRAPPA